MMINDPYIEIVSRTKQLGIEEASVIKAIDHFLAQGPGKTIHLLVSEEKIAEKEAGQLVEAIKKEFRSSYLANALYAGIFAVLFFAFVIITYYITGAIGAWLFFAMAVALYSTYLTIKNISRAMLIKPSAQEG